jgi:GxxExxY protein
MDNGAVDSKEKTFLYKEEGYTILGACFNVYKELGNGYLESVYQECLAIELINAGVPFVQQPKLTIVYLGNPISQYFVSDFLCFDKIIVELKTVKNICAEHRAQLFNYLKISGYKV